MRFSIISAFLASIALLVAALAVLLFTTAPCLAGWCPDYKCFGPCGGTCRCVSRDYSGGVCIDIELLPAAESMGWHELK